MKISTLFRHIREGGYSLIRNGWMTFASISSIAISLFILGLFLLLAVNVNHISQQLESKVEIKVFLDVNISQTDIALLRSQMEAIAGVEEVIFVSKDEGLELMRERMGDSGREYLEGLDGENNPLNDAFTVMAMEPRDVEQISIQIEALNDDKPLNPIIKVDYGKESVDLLFRVLNIIRNIGLVLVVFLGITAMFLISNTIKLTIMARNREIKIMKLVGATNGFIRWPFFIEGALLGMIGSLIPAAILSYGYRRLIEFSRSGFEMVFMEMKPFDDVYTQLLSILLAIGLGIGIWGSLLSVRKYLQT